MKIAIIDLKESRRVSLADHLGRWTENAEITSVAAGTLLPSPLAPQDLVLLHSGLSQEDDIGDSIHALLDRFGRESWVLCYSGATAVPAATSCPLETVAVFPSAVGGPGEDFLKILQKVISLLSERSTLPGDAFRNAVTEFDETLEANLDILMAVIQDRPAPIKRLSQVDQTCRLVFADDGTLNRGDHTLRDAVTDLRRLLLGD